MTSSYEDQALEDQLSDIYNNEEESMKLDFTYPMMTLAKDKALTVTGSTEEFLLRDVVVEALLRPDDKLSGKEKAERYILAVKIHTSPKEIDLTVEELAKIKELVGKVFAPLIVGQAWQMLEGK
jgi:hypothetical protein